MTLSKEEVRRRKKESDRKHYLKNRDKIIKGSTEWNKKNREYHREFDRKWRAKNPTKSRESYLKRTYRITLEEYERKRQSQDGRCAICLNQVERLVVDHNHDTDAIRELLCTTCNAGIGQFKENIRLLQKAIDYLKKHE